VNRCDEEDPGKLRIFFISQAYTDIDKALRTATVFRLNAESNRCDIEAYVHARCLEIQTLYSLDEGTIKDIEEATTARSQGAHEDFRLL
jgi:hypothetical protein